MRRLTALAPPDPGPPPNRRWWRRGSARPMIVILVAWIFFLGADGTYITVARGLSTGAGDVPLAFWAAPGLVALPLALRNSARRHYGPAVAWCFFALPFELPLALYSVHLTRVSVLFFMSSCDPMASPCSPHPPLYWLPLGLFTVCLALTVAAALINKRAEGKRQLWIVRPLE